VRNHRYELRPEGFIVAYRKSGPYLSTSSFQQVLFKGLLVIYVGRSEFLKSVSILATIFPLSVSE